MKKTILGLNRLENMVVNYRPSNNEIEYQFAAVIEVTEEKKIQIAIQILKNLVIENKVSINEIKYQFEAIRKEIA